MSGGRAAPELSPFSNWQEQARSPEPDWQVQLPEKLGGLKSPEALRAIMQEAKTRGQFHYESYYGLSGRSPSKHVDDRAAYRYYEDTYQEARKRYHESIDQLSKPIAKIRRIVDSHDGALQYDWPPDKRGGPRYTTREAQQKNILNQRAPIKFYVVKRPRWECTEDIVLAVFTGYKTYQRKDEFWLGQQRSQSDDNRSLAHALAASRSLRHPADNARYQAAREQQTTATNAKGMAAAQAMRGVAHGLDEALSGVDRVRFGYWHDKDTGESGFIMDRLKLGVWEYLEADEAVDYLKRWMDIDITIKK